jgi:uncharacterized protein YecT (DUF1311 family)
MLQPPLATSLASSARRTKAVTMRANHTFPDIMQSVRFLIAILVATQAWPAAALEAGQACRQARNWLERTLCSSAPLRQRDADLDQDFRHLLESAPRVARPSLAADQRQWRSALRSCRRRSHPLSCLHGRFEGRAAALRQHPDAPDGGAASSLPMNAGTVGLPASRGWTRYLRSYLKALQACKEESPEPIAKVLLGWQLPAEEAVGLRLVDRGLRQWVCVAHPAGHKVLRFGAARDVDPAVGPGPVYHPGGNAAPAYCVNAIEFVGANGRPAGWISERDC